MEHAKRLRPLVCDVSLMLNEVMRAGQVDPVRGRAGDAARHRPRHLSVRHLVERVDWRRLHGPRHRAAIDRRRAGRGQGLHDARRRRTAADRVDGRDGPAPARQRQRVRRGHRPAASLRLVRRGCRPLRRPHQRPRRAGADQARRARRPRAHRHLHSLPLRLAHADGISLGHRAAGCVRACLRVDAGLVDADQGHPPRSAICPRRRAATSRGSKRSPAYRPRSSPPARSATTPSSGKMCWRARLPGFRI